MAIQTFTAAQVLTAAQMNALQANDYNQTVSTKTASYVLVAADKGTRVVMNSASATTITVNTSLFAAGDSLRLQNINSGATVVTAGTATVTSAGSLSIPQWGGGQLYFTSASAAVYFPDATTGGLVFISATTISAANTASLPTNSFTSTYQNYLLQVTLSGASAGGSLSFRYRASGTDYSGAQYNTGGFNVTTGGTIGSDGQSSASATAHLFGYYGSADYLMAQITFFNPQGTGNSRFNSNSSGTNSTQAAIATSFSGGIVYQNTQYDAITLIASGATTITGTARLYGYLNS